MQKNSDFLDDCVDILDRFELFILGLEFNRPELAKFNSVMTGIQSIQEGAHDDEYLQLCNLARHTETLLATVLQATNSGSLLETPSVNQLLYAHDVMVACIAGLKIDPKFEIETKLKPTDAASPLPTVDGHNPEPGPDKNLSFQSLLRHQSTRYANDLVSLSDLLFLPMSGPNRTNAFTKKLLDILSLRHGVKNISRVALVRRIGQSNQLECVSVATHGHENTMEPGYRCFISRKSSIFALSPYSFRKFRSASEAVSSFTRNGRLPQRSITRIANMGYKSGFAAGIYLEHNLAGLLFLNSATDFLSSPPDSLLVDVAYALTLAQSLCMDFNADPLYQSFVRHDPANFYGTCFSGDELLKQCQSFAGHMWPGSVEFKFKGPAHIDTLVNLAHCAFIINRAALGCSSVLMDAHVEEGSLKILCKMDRQIAKDGIWQIGVIAASASNLGISLSVRSSDTVVIECRLDPIPAGSDYIYSI